MQRLLNICNVGQLRGFSKEALQRQFGEKTGYVVCVFVVCVCVCVCVCVRVCVCVCVCVLVLFCTWWIPSFVCCVVYIVMVMDQAYGMQASYGAVDCTPPCPLAVALGST